MKQVAPGMTVRSGLKIVLLAFMEFGYCSVRRLQKP